MSAIDFLDILIHVVFISLGAFAIVDYLRHKNETRRDVALMFGVLAIPFIMQLAARMRDEPVSDGAQIVSVIALVLEPYLLLRLVRHLQSMPAYMMPLVGYSLIVTVVVGILVGDRAPLVTTLVSQGYLIGFNLYAMVGFMRGVGQASGVRQKRLRFAAAGSGLFALIFVATLVSQELQLKTDFALLLLEALTGACVITYYIGFAPPRWLRQTWQLNELHHFLHQTSKRLIYERKIIFEELAFAALRSVGGSNAIVAGCDANGNHLQIEIQSAPPFEVDDLETEAGAIRKVWQEKKALMAKVPSDLGAAATRWTSQLHAQALFIVPISGAFHPWGLMIAAVQYAPLFPEDDLDVLALIAEQSAFQLDYSASIQELRVTNQSLEQRVSERTNELKKTDLALETQLDEFKQAEEQIEYQAYLLENVNDAVIGSDKNSIIRFWNSGAEAIFGWSSDEVVGRSGGEILHVDFLNTDRPSVLKILAEAGRWKGETIQRRKDGSAVVIESSSITLHDADGSISGYVSVNRDITARKKAEEEIHKLYAELEQRVAQRTQQLQESEEKFSKAFLASPAAVSIASMPDGVYLNVNEALASLTGYSREELLGHTSTDLGLVDNEDRTRILEATRIHGFARDIEIKIHTKSHRTADVLASIEQIEIGGRPCMLSVIYDITNRKQAEAEVQRLNDDLRQRQIALSEANSLLQTLLDNMPDHIYFKDTQSRFIKNSKSQATMMGVKDADLVTGKTDFDFFPREHAQRSYNEEQELMRSAQALMDIEERVVWPDGRVTWVSTTKLPLRNIKDEVIGTFGISRDITERKKAEEDLQRSNTQLEAANKELEAFSYSVSHDLRAPLRTIDGFSQAVMEDYGELLPEDGRSALTRVRKAAQFMSQLIDDMLNLSRVTRAPMKTEAVNLSKLAQGIFTELQRTQVDRQVKFISKPNLGVQGDPHLLHVVLENLLNNAWKFTSKRGQAEIELGSKRENEETIYFVRDNGAGFDMAYTSKLFGAFQRLHAMTDFPGTGVGLATVQRIIHRHGGRIWAQAELDRGATFFFTLAGAAQIKRKRASSDRHSVIDRANEII